MKWPYTKCFLTYHHCNCSSCSSHRRGLCPPKLRWLVTNCPENGKHPRIPHLFPQFCKSKLKFQTLVANRRAKTFLQMSWREKKTVTELLKKVQVYRKVKEALSKSNILTLKRKQQFTYLLAGVMAIWVSQFLNLAHSNVRHQPICQQKRQYVCNLTTVPRSIGLDGYLWHLNQPTIGTQFLSNTHYSHKLQASL